MEDRRVVLWQERDADRSNEVEREKAQLVARQTKEAAQLVARHFEETVQLLERQAAKTARLKTATEAAPLSRTRKGVQKIASADGTTARTSVSRIRPPLKQLVQEAVQ